MTLAEAIMAADRELLEKVGGADRGIDAVPMWP
jgi:hypothetical protein